MIRPEDTRSAGRWRRVDPDHQLPPPSPETGRRAYGDADMDRGVVGLLRSLAEDMATLVRQEVELARLEVSRTVRRLAADSAWIAVGVGIAAVGGLTLVIALALGLGALLGSYWLGTLITGLLLVLLGGGFLYKGVRDLRAGGLAPEQTTASLRDDARWAKDEAQELKQRLAEE